MQYGVTLDRQKIQAESQAQLQKAILNIGHTDHVDRDADPKEGRKKSLTGKKYLRISVLLAAGGGSFVYIFLLYICVCVCTTLEQ